MSEETKMTPQEDGITDAIKDNEVNKAELIEQNTHAITENHSEIKPEDSASSLSAETSASGSENTSTQNEEASQENKDGNDENLSECIVSTSKYRTKHELATGYGFNEDQIGIFEETFQIFDKDSDGFITLVEIRTVMNALGFFPCDENIRKSIQDIDNDNSGTVDFEEFISMMSKFRQIKTTSELEDELKEIFNIFDKNQDGFIDKMELKDVLMRLGENITDDEVIDMIKEADLDGDNKVSFSDPSSMTTRPDKKEKERNSNL